MVTENLRKLILTSVQILNLFHVIVKMLICFGNNSFRFYIFFPSSDHLRKRDLSAFLIRYVTALANAGNVCTVLKGRMELLSRIYCGKEIVHAHNVTAKPALRCLRGREEPNGAGYLPLHSIAQKPREPP